MNNYYTGIGSRNCPKSFIPIIQKIVSYFEINDWTLRSGGAEGADTYFEQASIRKEIYLPWKNFNNNKSELYKITSDAIELAKKYHPVFDKLSAGAQKLIARDGFQVLGQNLQTPSRGVICWTSEGKVVGGTAQALRIAQDYDIPIYNLYHYHSITLVDFLVKLGILI